MEWHILLSNGHRINDFDIEDEYFIRQAGFMEFGDWPFLIGESLIRTYIKGASNGVII